jgi:hypothetical protein
MGTGITHLVASGSYPFGYPGATHYSIIGNGQGKSDEPPDPKVEGPL